MAKRVFLHIGTMKSATTYIQDLCDLNATHERLGLTGHSRARLSTLRRPARATREHRTRSRGHVEAADSRDRGARRRRADLQRAARADQRRADRRSRRRAQGPAEVHVIITARDLARVIPSQWQTMTRNRRTVTWKDFSRRQVARYPSGAARRGSSGASRTSPRSCAAGPASCRWSRSPWSPCRRQGSPPDVLAERFGIVLGIDWPTLHAAAASNPSLGAHSAELLRRLNLRDADWDWLALPDGVQERVRAVRAGGRASQEPNLAQPEGHEMGAQAQPSRLYRGDRDAPASGSSATCSDLVPTIDGAAQTPVDPGALADR